MSTLNIMQISRFYYPDKGGVERTVQNIAEGLCRQVHMTVLTCRRLGAGRRQLIHGVEIYRLASLGMFSSLPISPFFLHKFKKLAENQDILCLHLPFPLADLGLFLSGYKGKVYIWWHSDVVRQKNMMLLYKPLMEKTLRRADKIIVGAYGIIEGSSYLMDYKDKCVVIPFGIEETPLYRNVPEGGGQETEIVFLFVGRLVYYKGCEILLSALKGISHARLVIAGNGKLEKKLRRWVSREGLSGRVTFCREPEDNELNQLLSSCDVFVFPSLLKSEAFGLVQLEAMAHGKPVINTWLPSGVPSVSLHGVTGLTVKPGSVLELREAMLWMMEHKEERLLMGKNGRERVRQEYTREKMLERVWELCKDKGEEML